MTIASLSQSPLTQLAALARQIANAEKVAWGDAPDFPGEPLDTRRLLQWRGQLDALATAGLAYGVQAGLGYDAVRQVVGNIAAACDELMHFGVGLETEPDRLEWDLRDCTRSRRGYLIGGEAARLLARVRVAVDELLILNAAAGSLSEAHDSTPTDWKAVVAAVADENAVAIINIAGDKTKSTDDKMRAIHAIDNRVIGWDSPKWAEVLRVSDAAIRKADWWKKDRPRLRR